MYHNFCGWARNGLQWSAYSGAGVRQRVSWIQHQCSTENSILLTGSLEDTQERHKRSVHLVTLIYVANTLKYAFFVG